jgi:glycosyltransferase involved in cell wall biosynthesis
MQEKCDTMKFVVVMVTENWWPSIGGIESSLYSLSNALAEFVDVHILAPSTKGLRPMAARVTTKILPRQDFFYHAESYIDQLGVESKIAHLFGYSYFDKAGQELLIRGLRRRRIPTLLKVPTLGHTVKYVTKTLIENVDCFIALTEAIAFELESYGIPRTDIFLVPNGVDVQYFKRASIDCSSRTLLTLGFAGRFTSQKQVSRLVNWVSSASLEYFVELRLVGVFDNTYGDVESFVVPSCVTLLPPTHDLLDFYSQIDIYASLSREEGMPNAVLEAMAAGKPVILSNVSGHQELVRGNGWLIDSEADFRLALGEAYRERGLNKLSLRGAVSRDIVEREFAVSDVAQRYLITYLKLLGQ